MLSTTLRSCRTEKYRYRIRWVWALIVVPLALAFLISSLTGHAVLFSGSRYLIYVVPFFHLAMAVGLGDLPRRSGLVFGSVTVALSLGFLWETVDSRQRPAWGPACAYVAEHATPNDLIIAKPHVATRILRYYLPGDLQVDEATPEYILGPILQRMQGRRSLWIVTTRPRANPLEQTLLRVNNGVPPTEEIFRSAQVVLRVAQYRLRP